MTQVEKFRQSKTANKIKRIIAADPAFRANGFGVAVIDLKTKTCTFHKLKKGFLQFQKFVQDYDAESTLYVVENSNLQNLSFDTTGTKAVVARKSRNVGTNQAVSQLTVDHLRNVAPWTNVIEISPKHKGKKVEDNKIFMAIVKSDGYKLEGYKGIKGDQDLRDAYQLGMIGKRMKRILST